MSDSIEIVVGGERPTDAKRVTDATLTMFEYTKIVATRARQLKSGDQSKIPEDELPYPPDPIKTAQMEVKRRVVPMVIVRRIPDATQENGFRVERWDLAEMTVRDY